MSDEDERQANSKSASGGKSHRRLATIKSKLQELTREKTKYNVEKLTQDIDFLQSEMGHLSHSIAEINKEINAQTAIKKTLNAKLAILRSNSGLRYSNLEIAHRDKERYEKELEKEKKSDLYRDLARKKLQSIVEALPQLEKQDQYNQQLQQAEDAQTAARNKREKLVENLNSKSRKQTEIKQLLADSTSRIPDLEAEIERLRLERKTILTPADDKKRRQRNSPIPIKSTESPVPSLEQDTLDFEKRQSSEQLEKLRLLIKYFQEKMSEHNLSSNETPCSTPSSELLSPFLLCSPITPLEEQNILSSYMDEPESPKTNNEPTMAVAMKLPRSFTPLDVHSTEIIHSPHYPKTVFEYKKELPSDIVDKYAGSGKTKHQQTVHGKKNKKNRKTLSVKHPSQMMVLYNDVRASTGNSDTLPFLPMYEYELLPTIKALQLLEQSVESYLKELSEHPVFDEPRSEVTEEEDIRDSALDTYSEASSVIESLNYPKDSNASVLPLLMNIPEARSSSSSDDKKTIISSASPPSSNHSHSKTDPTLLVSLATTSEECPISLPPLTIQIAQIERQISDEGYRSVRNEKQRVTRTNDSPILTRSTSYDSAEKVDRWLSSATTIPNTDFQAAEIDRDEEETVD